MTGPTREIEVALRLLNHRDTLDGGFSTDVPGPGVSRISYTSGKLASADLLPDTKRLFKPSQHEPAVQNGLMTNSREASTLTDVCNSGNLPEVEIFSLIEESFPRYRLRADTLTRFGGYDNEDWIQTPLVSYDTDLDLTDEQIELTLKYFTLCSERLSQMTKTYNDIECVTRLLEEKERDLELAAKIGQSLLESTRELKERNELLEDQLRIATERVNQLNHDLALKDNLLRVYIHDSDLTDSDGSPTKDTDAFNLANINIGSLQKKVKVLEDENLQLRAQAAQLKLETCTEEEKEQALTKDLCQQLDEANQQVKELHEDVTKRTEDNLRQQEETTSLLAQVVDMQKKLKSLTVENIELQKHLRAAQDTQRELSKELSDLQTRHDECLEMFLESQEDIKALRRKHKPKATRQHYAYSPFVPSDSLASELSQTIKDEMGYPDGYSPEQRKSHSYKIFDTYKAARQASKRTSYLSRGSSHLSIPGSNYQSAQVSPGGSSVASICPSDRSSMYLSDSESQSEAGYSADNEHNTGTKGSKPTNLGRPGIPGSNDLETALRRLTLRRRNELNEKRYKEETEERRKRHGSDGSHTPTPCRSPDSVISEGSGISGLSNLSASSHYGLGFRIPEKLQIVKPMEGSVTLHQWQRLATPHMGALLEDRPGIQIKGEEKIELEDTYNFSDYEEDDYQPHKLSERTSSIYTYTTSTVLHPSDDYNTQVSSSGSAARPSVISLQDTRGTSTFSMSLGLASMLKERNISAKTMAATSPTYTTTSPVLASQSSQSFTSMFSTLPSPIRYPNIMTETMYDGTHMHAYSIYSSTRTLPTTTSVSASSCSPSSSVLTPDFSHIRILDTIKTYGIGNILSSSAATAAVTTVTVTMATSTVTSIASTQTVLSSSFGGGPSLSPRPRMVAPPLQVGKTNPLMQIAGMQVPSRPGGLL